jgi:hypothetical protein
MSGNRMTTARDFARGVNPNHPATTYRKAFPWEREMTGDNIMATMHARAAFKLAVYNYHASLRREWRRLGKPSTSVAFQRYGLNAWARFIYDVKEASNELERERAFFPS